MRGSLGFRWYGGLTRYGRYLSSGLERNGKFMIPKIPITAIASLLAIQYEFTHKSKNNQQSAKLWEFWFISSCMEAYVRVILTYSIPNIMYTTLCSNAIHPFPSSCNEFPDSRISLLCSYHIHQASPPLLINAHPQSLNSQESYEQDQYN